MKEKSQPHRYWMLSLILLAALALFWTTLIVTERAVESARLLPKITPEPIWHSFQLTDEPIHREVWDSGSGVEVYKNYILWSEQDYLPLGTGGTPSCIEEETKLASMFLSWPQPFVGYGDADICLFDSHTGLITRLIDSNETDTAPSMDGDWVAFERTASNVPRIVLYNLTSGQETVITETIFSGGTNPVISGDWVAYDSPFTGELYAYKLSTGQIFTLMPYSTYYLAGFDMHEQTVVWNNQSNAGDYAILSYNLTSQTAFTVSTQVNFWSTTKIYGDIIVWDWNEDIYGYDLSSSQYLTITNDPYPQSSPDIYENIVVWWDGRHGRSDIYGIDLQSGQIFSVTQEANPVQDVLYPDIWGDIVAWQGSGNQGAAAAIKMTDFSFMPLFNRP